MTRTSLLTIPAIAFGLLIGSSAVAPQEASADVRVRIGGRAHVRINGGGGYYGPRRVRVIRPWYRHRPISRPVIHVGGHIWLGGGYYYERPFAQPPPPPAPPVDCNCGPEYYGPIAPAPAPYAAAMVVTEEPRLSRWGLGVFMGGVSVDGEHEGEDVGLIGQLRLTRGLLVEGEIAKNTLEDGGRIDRRMLVGLNYEFGAQRKLAPYVTAGIGTTQVEVEGGWEDNQAIAELGAGLRLRLSDRISLFGDLRFGSRDSLQDDDTAEPLPEPGTAGRALMPEGEEEYSRIRLGGMITF